MTSEIKEAYHLCKRIALSHYENFPVGSILLPKQIRYHIYAIYAFARTADDIVDNESLSQTEKVSLLNEFRSDFDQKKDYYKKRNHQICHAVNLTIEEMKLSRSYFYDLLDAFNQDISKESYQDLNELTDYARRSADPVGRLLLELVGQNSAENNRLSDLFCSSLQFINFWQDLSIDRNMKRFYVPVDVMLKHGYELNDFYFDVPDDRHSLLVDELLDWTEKKFNEAKNLLKNLNGRFKIELILIWWGGFIILKQCRLMKSNLLLQRPTLNLKTIVYSLFSNL